MRATREGGSSSTSTRLEPPKAARKDLPEFFFKSGKAGIQQLRAWHDDDVNTCRGLVEPEDLSNQSFSSIPLNRAAQLPGRRDSQPARRAAAPSHKQGQKPAAKPRPLGIDLAILGAAADPIVWSKLGRRRRQGWPGAGWLTAYSLLTVRRLRPLARRRLSTSRPFFVLILTRNPCVRRRRRRFG